MVSVKGRPGGTSFSFASSTGPVETRVSISVSTSTFTGEMFSSPGSVVTDSLGFLYGVTLGYPKTVVRLYVTRPDSHCRSFNVTLALGGGHWEEGTGPPGED